jgi:glycosyltransferase involved in cell wall biosynthesis
MNPRRRVAVYNKYWHSRGGGERYTGMVAQVLSRTDVDVELIAHESTDLGELGAYLGLDLNACSLRVIPDVGEGALAQLMEDYDLLVNGSYMSRLPARPAKAMYLCYFPTPADHDLPEWQRRAARAFGRIATSPSEFSLTGWGVGWFPAATLRLRTVMWTNGRGRLQLPPGKSVDLLFDVARLSGPPTKLDVTVDGTVIGTFGVEPRFEKARVTVPESSETRELVFESDWFAPEKPDQRRLGVAISRLRFGTDGRHPSAWLGARFPWLLRDPRGLSFLDGYQVIVAISSYTAEWIQTLWNRSTEIMYPPIHVESFEPAPERDRSIVTVGRFFPPGAGHSKRQVEQVQTFGAMVREGQLTGWTLHVIGGCEPAQESYLDAVRSEAAGLPVEIHPNAPRDTLARLMNRAAIHWSATGYGQDESRSPWASEHFGITTAEAMAAGCVPIVIDKAGQREIVRDGVDGYRWTTLAELRDLTLRVANDEALRAQLTSSARARSLQYSDDAFAEHLLEIVERNQLL